MTEHCKSLPSCCMLFVPVLHIHLPGRDPTRPPASQLLYNFILNFKPWPTLNPFTHFVMTPPGSRFHKLSLSPTTKSPLRCRMVTMPPAHTTWYASSWEKSTPATIPERIGTPVRPNLSGTGA